MLRKGFTLAEVLIALLLVGILSSISIQTLRNRDNSAEYEALKNKAVTNIQGVMHEALFTKKSSEIFDDNFETLWGEVNKRLSTDTGSIKSKDGAINITTSQVMRDGVNYAYTPKEGNSHVAEITIDVNGSKAPNEEGKDIYKYSMDKFGNILLATLPDAPDKEYCPDGVTVKNSDGSNCPKCTDGSDVTTPDRSNCPKCPNGTTERNSDGSNCDKCANGTMANADRSNCPKCANGQEANATRSNCPKCGIQTIEANATRSNCPKCPDGTTEKTDTSGTNCSDGFCVDPAANLHFSNANPVRVEPIIGRIVRPELGKQNHISFKVSRVSLNGIYATIKDGEYVFSNVNDFYNNTAPKTLEIVFNIFWDGVRVSPQGLVCGNTTWPMSTIGGRSFYTKYVVE